MIAQEFFRARGKALVLVGQSFFELAGISQAVEEQAARLFEEGLERGLVGEELRTDVRGRLEATDFASSV